MSAIKTKVCPFCAETIKAAAVLCRFCGRELGRPSPAVEPVPASDSDPPPERLAAPSRIETPEIFDTLTALVEKSLVVYEEDAQGQGRYRLLETVRQYGRDRLLESKGGENLRNRHGGYFLRLAEEAEPKLLGPEQGEWMASLQKELDNGRAALEWWLRSDESADAGLRLATALTTFWQRWGYHQEARDWLDRVLAASREELSAARVKALLSAGKVALIQGDSRAARSFLEAGLAGAHATGDPWDLMIAHAHLVLPVLTQGELDKARFHAAECQTFSQQIGTAWAAALARYPLGVILLYERDFAAAADHLVESISAFREVGDLWSAGFGCVYLARAAYYLGDLTTVRARLDEAQSVFEALGVRIGRAWVLLCRGIDADDQEDHRTAAARYEESLLLFRELDAVRGQAHALHCLGRLAHDFDTARACFRESLELFETDGNPSGVSRVLFSLASLALASGEPARAARLFGAAAAVPDTSELPLFRAAREECDRCLIETRAALGEPAFAAAWAEGQALSLEQAIALGLQQSGEHGAREAPAGMGRHE